MSTKTQISGQPSETAIGPPFSQAKGNAVNVPARTEMIVNEIAKLVNAPPASRQLLLVAHLGELLLVGPRLSAATVAASAAGSGCVHLVSLSLPLRWPTPRRE